jgi:hypothetical protein
MISANDFPRQALGIEVEHGGGVTFGRLRDSLSSIPAAFTSASRGKRLER